MTSSPPSSDTFLERRRARKLSDDLSRWLVLGLLVSFLLVALGIGNQWFNPTANPATWIAVTYAGIAACLLTLVFPGAWVLPERGMRVIGTIIGRILFGLVLTMVYFLLFWPVGVWIRRRRGTHPIYAWRDAPPSAMEGWRDVAAHDEIAGSGQRRGILFLVAFFVKRGNLIFLPAIILLVSLGLVLFFVQSSAFAPFIYTLF